jgi:hypothetical protein
VLSGGGKLVIEVQHTLTVDGYIQANSKAVHNAGATLASGGSGGSIIIRTVNITGNHTFYNQNLILNADDQSLSL